ncbi:hypothetical protein H0H81_010396 [Sphagnurus paluster]|uniref:Uncharacterized protein n=1 Tax=Sphagnurus paluster TaxID=117069 RepID=A0A9P7FPB7_9AGAR|nr:hypothetical protein H0H81_010396 [Sphagnurus paluster]
MPSLRDSFRFKKKHTSQPIDEGKQSVQEDGEDGQKPTAIDYATETGKAFIPILESIADLIPVPFVGPAIKIAINILKIFQVNTYVSIHSRRLSEALLQEGHAILDQAGELKRRVESLAKILVVNFQGKSLEDIQEGLMRDVKNFAEDLEYVKDTIDELLSERSCFSNVLQATIFRGANDDRVKKCMQRLSNSLENFHLSRTIDNSIITERHFKALQDRRPEPPPPPKPGPRSRTAVPASTGLFRGREAVVADLIKVLTAPATDGQKAPRACILGPGGMGKTSTSLIVMAHPDLQKCFPPVAQVWVPCANATSISGFLDTLYSSLSITVNSGNIRQDILDDLRSSEPLILLLDNFETPFNIEGKRAEMERLIRDIHQIPHITLFVNLRSSAPPCDDISWHSVSLEAVGLDTAQQIYSDIHTGGGADPNLPDLLAAIGRMPLAITLIAKAGKLTGLSAGKLLQEFNKHGTGMLGQGSDAEHSMDVCISLSVDIAPMKAHPEAFDLLAIIAMLASGSNYENLSAWWACDIPNLMGALEVLRDASLLERRDSMFFVLPVIRRYVLHPSRFPEKIRNSVVGLACKFLDKHFSYPGRDKEFERHSAIISAQEANLCGIFHCATTPSPHLINSLIKLANHQYFTRPRREIIRHALMLVRKLDDETQLHARVLFHYGNICFRLSHYLEAEKRYQNAREMFLSISDKSYAAECLLQCFQVLQCAGEPRYKMKKAPLLWQALAEFEEINDTRGIALCSLFLGTVHQGFQHWEQARDSFWRAWEMFDKLKDSQNQLSVAIAMADLYYWWRVYDLAESWAEYVACWSKGLGNYHHFQRTQVRARLRIIKRDFVTAEKLLTENWRRSMSCGAPLETGQALEDLGRTWAKMGQKDKAILAFKKCLRIYTPLEVPQVHVCRCQYFIRKLEDPSSIPTTDEIAALSKFYPEDIMDLL